MTSLPAPLRLLFSKFPLYTYPPIDPPSKSSLKSPTLWINPPRSSTDLLSADVECLKWQAYLALRGLKGIQIRWDVSPDGGIDGRLPNLHVPLDNSSELLAAHSIPSWVDAKLEDGLDPLEGYRDEASRDESRAWVSLLEGTVHAALVLASPQPSFIVSILSSQPKETRSLDTLLSPPPPPLFGLSTIFPPFGTHVSASAVESKFREAVTALSERLGTDKWFLGSSDPTALDALVFAYLHSIVHAKDSVRIEVTRRVNLVAWEWRVRSQIRAAFQHELSV